MTINLELSFGVKLKCVYIYCGVNRIAESKDIDYNY